MKNSAGLGQIVVEILVKHGIINIETGRAFLWSQQPNKIIGSANYRTFYAPNAADSERLKVRFSRVIRHRRIKSTNYGSKPAYFCGAARAKSVDLVALASLPHGKIAGWRAAGPGGTDSWPIIHAGFGTANR